LQSDLQENSGRVTINSQTWKSRSRLEKDVLWLIINLQQNKLCTGERHNCIQMMNELQKINLKRSA
jgi:hypothetical protein